MNPTTRLIFSSAVLGALYGRTCMKWFLGGVVALSMVACGGSSPSAPSSSPSAPSPLPQVTIQVSPNPLQASLKSASNTGGTFEFPVTVTFRENAGTSGQITQLTGTATRQPGNQMSSATKAVSL